MEKWILFHQLTVYAKNSGQQNSTIINGSYGYIVASPTINLLHTLQNGPQKSTITKNIVELYYCGQPAINLLHALKNRVHKNSQSHTDYNVLL